MVPQGFAPCGFLDFWRKIVPKALISALDSLSGKLAFRGVVPHGAPGTSANQNLTPLRRRVRTAVLGGDRGNATVFWPR